MRIVLLYVLLPIILLLVVFYWWAQRSNLPYDQLHTEIKLDNPELADKDTFSVMTYNIGYLSGMTNNLPVSPPTDLFDENLGKARALISKWQPDVIGFQEIDFGSGRSHYRDQLDSLGQGFNYAVKSVNWDKNYVPFPYWPPSVHFGKVLSGQAVLSKFKVNQSERIVLTGPSSAPFYYKAFYLDRLIQVVELTIGDQKVVVLNVHLEAFDQQTRELQAREVLQVVDQYATRGPLLLIGDFNARPPFATDVSTNESTISMFLDHPLLSPALDERQYLANEAAHFTFDTKHPYEKLDYIFYTHQSIEPVEIATLREAGEISDHFPLYMSFKFRPQ